MKTGSRRMVKGVALIAIICLAAFGMFGCGQGEEKVVEKEVIKEVVKEVPRALEPLKLAVAGAHTGDLASYGIPSVRAAEILVEHVNATQGGVGGRKVILVTEDDACKPEMATNAATKLVGEDVDLVVGHICSGATKAALGIYKDSGIIAISPSATNPDLTQSGDYPNFFRTIASDDAQARLEVDFALDTLGLTKIAVLHDKGDYGKGLAEFAKKFLEESGKAEVVLYEGITPGGMDYSAVVQKINRSGAQAVIFGGYHPEASKIVMQMRKKDMDTIFISDDGVKDDTFIKVAGDYAEGVYATGPKDTSKNPLAIEADKLHKEKYGEDYGAFYLNAYSAVLALFNAVDKSGSTDYEAVSNALRNEYVATPLGIIKFDDRGDAIGVGFSVYQVQNGKYVELEG
ncbi:branched-chain amino acid transport system substrate-binding protein [Desulfatibacillum alkenivorans DSM 16219]|uniref:Branched-chain amino acid transport system substrate-binding protein n=1 Tax=Desulfatibacillum alkenivorans DSM 16219 TaxID=1121393 RepID=A0A1M6KNL6_9BACT|nr:branched-chain amino acid ABC transporter substrate-binding protein [Desulfatibacillum alkenivorans]SHJ60527.1 branched-chain amino acid transport system substrate-binding protein [Desulfatibacillum alkenivorans DSM 16219]